MKLRSRRLVLTLGSIAPILAGCESLTGRQNASPPVPHDAAVAVLVAGVLFVAIAVGAIGWELFVHCAVSRRLGRLAQPKVIGGMRLGLVPGHGVALVAGILRPAIYCSDDVLVRLDEDELRALLQHEGHHQLTHAPARLVLVSGLALAFGRIGPIGAWLEDVRAEIEIAADAHAILAGSNRRALARAILKLHDGSTTVSAAEFASAGQIRLHVLLGDETRHRTRCPDPVLGHAAVVSIVLVICSVLAR
jgi:Zn-dependent protease with chaperone function